VRLTPQLDGGGHENGFRSGTLNVPAIVGVGMACEVARQRLEADARRIGALRDRLEQGILQRIPDVSINGDPEHRLPGTTNLAFAAIPEGDLLLAALNRDVACSSGSACTSASMEPSYVLRALGVADELAFASIRFSLGRKTTEEEVDFVIERVVRAVNALRVGASHASPA
jgi:cysteine desulfurase